MKEIREGRKINERFRSSESVESEQFLMKKHVNIYTLKIINLFSWITLTYEQIEIGGDIISKDQSKFLY